MLACQPLGARIRFDGQMLGNTGRTYDLSHDGQRLLMIKDPSADVQASGPNMIVVQNWLQELHDRVRLPR